MKTTDYYRLQQARQRPRSPAGALQRLQQARNVVRRVLGRSFDQRTYGGRLRRP